MSKIIAIIYSEEALSAFGVSEILQNEAKLNGLDIEIELKTPIGLQNFQEANQIEVADLVVFVGDVPFESRFNNCRNKKQYLVQDILSKNFSLKNENNKKEIFILAVTSCPTGIAHTFMAAEALEIGAKKLGYKIKVETRGSVGSDNQHTKEEIEKCDFVIIAADTNVNKSNFVGKKLFETNTKMAINDPEKLIAMAMQEATPYLDQSGTKTISESGGHEKKGFYKHLMSGVSFMLPFVVAGGLLIALSFAFGGIFAYEDSNKGTLSWYLFQIGAKAAFTLIIPVLSGYISYSIADRPGLAPGMIGGMLAASGGSGFLGGIFAGFIAGYGTLFLNKKIKLPKSLEGLKPVLILPLLSATVTGLMMTYIIGKPVSFAMTWLETNLKAMQATGAGLLGALLGGMMAVDMGGPFNKASYAFSTGIMSAQIYKPIAAAMVGGMTPPLGIALATWIFKKHFSKDEQEAGKATAVLGISFITEGAIPFAAKDPFRILPATIIGSALAGSMSMIFDVELKAPHGGIFVLFIPNAVTHLGAYVGALLAGTIVTALLIGLFKKI